MYTLTTSGRVTSNSPSYRAERERSRPRPIPRPKIPLLRNIQPSHTLPISRIHIHIIPPPVRKHGPRVRDTEKNDDTADSDTRVESGGQDVVVFGPPGEEFVFDPVVEYEIDDCPAGVVYSGCCTSINQYLRRLKGR